MYCLSYWSLAHIEDLVHRLRQCIFFPYASSSVLSNGRPTILILILYEIATKNPNIDK